LFESLQVAFNSVALLQGAKTDSPHVLTSFLPVLHVFQLIHLGFYGGVILPTSSNNQISDILEQHCNFTGPLIVSNLFHTRSNKPYCCHMCMCTYIHIIHEHNAYRIGPCEPCPPFLSFSHFSCVFPFPSSSPRSPLQGLMRNSIMLCWAGLRLCYTSDGCEHAYNSSIFVKGHFHVHTTLLIIPQRPLAGPLSHVFKDH
jgi:hypothetical protein